MVIKDTMEMMRRHIGGEVTEERLRGGYVKYIRCAGRRYEVEGIYTMPSRSLQDAMDIVTLKNGHERIAYRVAEVVCNPGFTESQFDDMDPS